ncbi:MAG: hypothetical protein AB1656_05545 [Candidatus Omnitrophota bacterium]
MSLDIGVVLTLSSTKIVNILANLRSNPRQNWDEEDSQQNSIEE